MFLKKKKKKHWTRPFLRDFLAIIIWADPLAKRDIATISIYLNYVNVIFPVYRLHPANKQPSDYLARGNVSLE